MAVRVERGRSPHDVEAAVDFVLSRAEDFGPLPKSWGDVTFEELSRQDAEGQALPGAAAFLAFDGVDVVGAALSEPRDSDRQELTVISVGPGFRGQGVGRDLLLAVVSHARDANRESVTLVTSSTNTSARRTYEAAGFTVVGTVPDDRSDGGDTLHYRLPLAGDTA